MNTQSNAAYEPSPLPQRIPSAMMSTISPLYWSVRRELWENRSIYLGGPAVASLMLVGIAIGHLRPLAQNAQQPLMLVERLYNLTALGIMATTFLVAFFYCLDALHGERRDRSILFWKSLPVSDLTTVLSKAIIPIVVLPLITFATTVVTQLIVLVLSSIILGAHGMDIAPLWNLSSLCSMSLMLLFHLLAIHGLWYAPIYCWLLLVSAWAKRVPFLWAVVPVAGIAIVEKIAFGTSYLGTLLGNRVSGGSGSASFAAFSMSMNSGAHIHLGEFLMAPGLWIGLAIATAFLAGAIQLRRYRGPL
jgi:ABC-2 type transport system permease protein